MARGPFYASPPGQSTLGRSGEKEDGVNEKLNAQIPEEGSAALRSAAASHKAARLAAFGSWQDKIAETASKLYLALIQMGRRRLGNAGDGPWRVAGGARAGAITGHPALDWR